MRNSAIEPDHPGYGSMALWSRSSAVAFPQFDDADAALAFVDSLKLLAPTVFGDWGASSVSRSLRALPPIVRSPVGASPAGSTWGGAVAVPFHLAPSETVSLEFVYAWHFPNRYADFDRYGDLDDGPVEGAWVGNHYATRFGGAAAVVQYFSAHADELLSQSGAWHDAVYGSALPAPVAQLLGVQASLARSPTTCPTADERFYGYEGVLGESTLNWNGKVGGSCPLNRTHVRNYEQALSRLFPVLERSMRETDWDVLQAPERWIAQSRRRL